MPIHASASSPRTHSLPVRTRILRQARVDFFSLGYSRFTMDELASELGMSKKTLYVHFAGKDEIIGAVIQDLGAEVRANAETILANRDLNFAEKLRDFADSVMERLAQLDPRTLRDLERFAPDLFALIDEVRRKNIPYIFGRLVEEGRTAGMVRGDAPAAFAIEFFLQAMHGLQQGGTLQRLGLTPREVIARGIDLFFGGLLTPAGHKQYEKLSPR